MILTRETWPIRILFKRKFHFPTNPHSAIYFATEKTKNNLYMGSNFYYYCLNNRKENWTHMEMKMNYSRRYKKNKRYLYFVLGTKLENYYFYSKTDQHRSFWYIIFLIFSLVSIICFLFVSLQNESNSRFRPFIETLFTSL